MADYTLKPVENDGYTLVPDDAVEPSKAFLGRLSIGGALQQNFAPIAEAAKSAKEAFGSEPLGLSQDHVKQLMDAGIFRDPATGRGGALRFMNEAAIMPLSVLGDSLVRGGQAAVGAVAGAVGKLVGEAPGGVLGPEQRAKNEVTNFLNYQMLRGDHEFGRADHVEGHADDTPIGVLPRQQDFNNAASIIERIKKTKEQAEQVQQVAQPDPITVTNLIDLWKQRGIHPAEAAHDAANDNLLREELITKPYHLTDNSGIPHPTNSPVQDGTPRSELAKTGDSRIDRLLQDETLRNVIDNPIVNRKYRVPYTAGGSVPLEDPTIYIDKDFPQYFTINGVTFDAAHFFVTHENPEQLVIDILTKGGMAVGPAYKFSHFEVAEKMEGAMYRAHGIDKEEAEAAYAPYMAQIQHASGTDFPPNLFDRPYPHDHPSAAKHEAIEEPGPSKAEIAQAHQILDDYFAKQEKGMPARALGAAPSNDIPELPAKPEIRTPYGRAVEAGRKAMDDLFGLGRSVQFMLDPMATGSDRAMVVAKDAINSVRRIRYEHLLADQELVRTFKPEQLERMWNALDEESVLQQEGKTSEHMGLATLNAKERAAVEKLMPDSQHAWLHAQDAGVVEGEGLPAYAPRMMINMTAIGGNAGPRALNELGRNIFTRTPQMLHRKYLLAEETEASAKTAVRKQMEEMKATPEEIEAALKEIKINRDIRTLPLATARMEEAAIWKDMINKIEAVGKATGNESVSIGSKPGPGWFTIPGNPAFTKWTPDFRPMTDLEAAPFPAEGRMIVKRNENGDIIFSPKPIYLPIEYEGPMRSIMDSGLATSSIVRGTQSVYGALMSLKARSMTAIMNSPLIHNEVIWGKAVEAVGGKQMLGFRLYFRGNRVAFDKQRAGELIERGLAPIGQKGAFQEISGMAKGVELEPGDSWTAKLLSAIPGLFSEGAETAVKRAIDKAGDFVHNRLLWDRVRDLQFGLADYLSDELVAKGSPRIAADRMAAQFANLITGSMPKESMSEGARATANLALFSRSFTLGNLAVYKQAVTGMPAPIRAQIERDLLAGGEAPKIPSEAAAFTAKLASQMARRKAISTIAMSIGLYYVGNALLQNAFNIGFRDSSWPEEMRGYTKRFADLMKDVENNPLELRHLIGRLSPTYQNEPNKQDRAYIADTKDGQGIYARNPVGKFGEEMIGYPTHPADMILRKLAPLPATILELLENDKGFGHKIYDPTDSSSMADFKIAMAVAKHVIEKELPTQQLQGTWDLLHDRGDQKLNTLRALGPAAGFTVSVGDPGGGRKAEWRSAKEGFNTRFDLSWPDIKKQIQNGDEPGARGAMNAIGVPLEMQKSLIRSTRNPGALSARSLREFYQYATPEQIRRFEAH